MKQILAPMSCAACLALAASAWAVDDTAGNEAPESAWQTLFNGKDLDGWVAKIRGYEAGENPHETFRVEDGLLTVSYDGYDAFDEQFGHLHYERPYSHYRLRMDYRFIGEQAPGAPGWAYRNSGVMVHGQAPHSMPAEQDFPISIEVQFLGGRGDGESRPTANMCSPGTHIVYQGAFNDTHCINADAPTFHGDEWVTVEVLVLGDELVVHHVNGEEVMRYGGLTTGGGVVSGHWPALKPEGQPLSGGYLSLQSEGHPIQFRNIRLLDLAGCQDPEHADHRPWYVTGDDADCGS